MVHFKAEVYRLCEGSGADCPCNLSSWDKPEAVPEGRFAISCRHLSIGERGALRVKSSGLDDWPQRARLTGARQKQARSNEGSIFDQLTTGINNCLPFSSLLAAFNYSASRSLSHCLSVCLCRCLSSSLSVYLFLCLSACLSVSVCLCLCLSVCLSVSLSSSLSVLPPPPPLSLPLFLPPPPLSVFVSLCLCLSVCLSVSLTTPLPLLSLPYCFVTRRLARIVMSQSDVAIPRLILTVVLSVRVSAHHHKIHFPLTKWFISSLVD